jgi:hypothetical protein
MSWKVILKFKKFYTVSSPNTYFTEPYLSGRRQAQKNSNCDFVWCLKIEEAN